MREKNKTDLVPYQGIMLPAYLFNLTFKDKQQLMLSPSVYFDPIKALDNAAWQNSSIPSSAPRPKVLLISQGANLSSDSQEGFLLLYWLKQLGFQVFLFKESTSSVSKCAIEKFSPLPEMWITGLAGKSFALFDPNKHFTLLANKGIARDQVVVLNDKMIRLIQQAAMRSCHPENGMQATSGEIVCYRSLESYHEKNRGGLEGIIRALKEMPLTSMDLFRALKEMPPSTSMDLSFLNFSNVESSKTKIETPSQLLRKIKKHPKKAEKLLRKHHEILEDAFNLGEMMEACPNKPLKIELLEKYQDKIKNGYELGAVIKACPNESLKVWLLEEHQNKIKNGDQLGAVIKACPNESLKIGLLEKYQDKIKDGYELGVVIKACPNESLKVWLLEEHQNKIKDGDQLGAVMEVCPNESLKIGLLEAHQNKIKNGDQLASIIRAYPEKTNDLLINHHEKIKCLSGLKSVIAESPLSIKAKILHSMEMERHDKLIEAISVLYPKKEHNPSFVDTRFVSRLIVWAENSSAFNRILDEIKNNRMISLAYVEIHGGDKDAIQSLLDALSTYCRNTIQHIQLPAENSFHSFSSHGFQPFSFIENLPAELPSVDPTIWVGKAQGTLPKFSIQVSKNPSFEYLKSGEILNPCGIEPQRVRVGIVQRDLTQSLNQTFYTPNMDSLLEVSYLKLSNHDIQHFKVVSREEEGGYYQFTQILLPNTLNRLFSIDPHEQFIGIVGNRKPQIYLGDDGFFYAKTTNACDCTYVIKAATKKQQMERYNALKESSLVRKIIDNYKSISLGYLSCTPDDVDIPTARGKPISQWLEEMYEFRGGTCSHRVAAVEYKLRQEQALNSDCIRTVDVDASHVWMEIFIQNNWIIIDLGGMEAEISYIQNKAHSADSKDASQAQSCSLQDALKIELKKLMAPSQIRHFNGLIELLQKESQKLGLISYHDEIEMLTCELLKQIKNTHSSPCVYIMDHVKSTYCDKKSIHIDEDKKVSVKLDSQLVQFFQMAQLNPDQPAWLIILWDHFTPSQQVALNTLLDCQPTIAGQPLPDNIHLIGLYKNEPQDPSIYSRYDLIADIKLPSKSESLPPTGEIHLEEIDCFGLKDWQAQLLGPVTLEGDTLIWAQPNWIQKLYLGKNVTIQIKNLPKGAMEECTHLINRARALGKFNYHGFEIPYPEEKFFMEIDASEYDFQDFRAVNLVQNVVPDQVPSDALLINGQYFDALLHNKIIKDDEYFHLPGILKSYANQLLSLWVTGKLSISQWYALFSLAETYQVSLTLYLPTEVSLPREMKEKPMENKAFRASQHATVVVTNDAEKYVNETIGCHAPSTLVIDVEDMSYASLIETLDFKIEDQYFRHFSTQFSELFPWLQDPSATVIFKGCFSQILLEALHPLLIGFPLKLSDGSTLQSQARLIFILAVEPFEIPLSGKHYPPLSFLGQSVQTYYYPTQKNDPFICYQENLEETFKPQEARQETQKFIDGRIAAVKNAFNICRVIWLLGETGVGKSYLVKTLADQFPEQTTVYYGLESLVAWANDTSGKETILFLDEVNILDKHFTWLYPLIYTHNETPIFYEGHLYTLSLQHQVIMACNSLDYGGGRHQPKILTDARIPQLHFSKLPDYVYYDLLSTALSKFWENPQQLFQILEKEILPLRKQQFLSIDACYYQAMKLLVLNSDAPTIHINSDTDFTLTPSAKKIANEISIFIQIHQAVYQVESDLQIPNGYSLDGASGLGKSVLIKSLLKAHQYQPKNPNGFQSKWYDKIDASLALSEIKDRILEAFDQGQVIWIDELNSISDSGIESMLNSVLSSIHPDTGQPARQPGFMAFFTGNSIALEGRAALSRALKRRCVSAVMSYPNAEDIEAIIQAKLQQHQLDQLIDMTLLAEAYAQLIQESPNINLRLLTTYFDQIIELYLQLYDMRGEFVSHQIDVDYNDFEAFIDEQDLLSLNNSVNISKNEILNSEVEYFTKEGEDSVYLETQSQKHGFFACKERSSDHQKSQDHMNSYLKLNH